MLVDEEVEVKLSRYNRKRYVNLGYQDAETADSLMVKVKDLPQSYRNKVRVKCDYCGEIKEVGYSAYLRSIAIWSNTQKVRLKVEEIICGIKLKFEQKQKVLKY